MVGEVCIHSVPMTEFYALLIIMTLSEIHINVIGAVQPHPLECVAVTNPRLVWVSFKNIIKVFSRGREAACYQGHTGNVHILLPFGEHLISVDDQNCLKIWDIKARGICIILM